MASSTCRLPFFALTTAGLETISAQEITRLPGISVDTISYRCISGTCTSSLAALCGLRTVDDVFLEVANWTDIGRPRSNLDRLHYLAASLNLYAAAAACASMRAICHPPTFSLTVSFIGKRNYSSEEMKQALASGIEERHHGWVYQQDDRLADLNIRVFLVHENAHIGVRVSKTALHDRSYRRSNLPGALKASVAAALVQLAQVTPGSTVLDPCCGSGTILVEAALQGAIACGGDYNPNAVSAAQENGMAAGVTLPVSQWDATALPIADHSIEYVISNLPWGRQVQVEEALPLLYRRLFIEMHRVLAPSGKLVVLTNAPEMVNPPGMTCSERLDISLFGQRPTILIFSSAYNRD